MLRSEIFRKVELENARSKEKYGLWPGKYTDQEQGEAIRSEFAEYYSAFAISDIHGDHGEIVEAVHTINVLVRRIQFLSGEADA